MNELEKALEKYFLELPLNFQRAIREASWKQAVTKIGIAHNLTSDQLTALEAETLMVIYDIEEARNYINNLTQGLGVAEEKASTIASDITKEVFEVIENTAKALGPKNKLEAPVIITQETKKAVIEQLSQRIEAARQGGASVKPIMPKQTTNNPQPTTGGAGIPEIAPEVHPMIKKGEVAHEVPHFEASASTSAISSIPKPIAPIPQPRAAQPEPKPVQPPVQASPIPQPVAKSQPPQFEPTLQNPNPTPATAPVIPAVKTVEVKKSPTPANTHYPGGLDPYREPLV